jgi:hypothetical protein
MLDTLDIIKHNSRVLKITTRLHLFHQVHTKDGPHLRHLENKQLLRVQSLNRKHVLLNVGPVAIAPKFSNAVHDPKSL